MEFDPTWDEPRKRLFALLEGSGQKMGTISNEVLGRNHAYLQQYFSKRSPQVLGETDRTKLAMHFGVSPDEFRPQRLVGLPQRLDNAVLRAAIVATIGTLQRSKAPLAVMPPEDIADAIIETYNDLAAIRERELGKPPSDDSRGNI